MRKQNVKQIKNTITFFSSSDDHKEAEQDQASEVISTSIKDLVNVEHLEVEELTKSQVVEEEEKKDDNREDEQKLESEGWAIFRADGVEFQLNLKQRVEKRNDNAEHDAEKEDDDNAERYFIGESGPLRTINGRKLKF